MPRKQVYPQAGDRSEVTEHIQLPRICNLLHSEATGICECGWSRNDHNEEARRNGPDTNPLPTDAFERLVSSEGFINYRPDYGYYARLAQDTYVNKISRLFCRWGMRKPDLLLSVLSEADPTTAIESSNQDNRTAICKDLVKAASSTDLNVWIITGGLNKGVDKLIGEGVKRRLKNKVPIPEVVLGISNWGCLENMNSQHNNASSEIFKPVSMNYHHTHTILVDDGTQKEENHCDVTFREELEKALTTKTTDDEWSGIPLIYILIGGGLEEFRFVLRALDGGSPVIITSGTGGASDIIYAAMKAREHIDATLEHLPDIFGEPFNQLKQWLSAKTILHNKAMKPKMFCKIVTLLDKFSNFEKESKKLTVDIANMSIGRACDALTEIKELISNRVPSVPAVPSVPSVDIVPSAAFNVVNTVSGMHAVFKKLLVVSGIDPELADQDVNGIASNILTKVLPKFRQVGNDLGAIRKHNRKDSLLLKFNTHIRITSLIVKALTKVKWSKPNDVYTLAVDWDHELFFTDLLRCNWKPEVHKYVIRKLLHGENSNRYIQLMLENMEDCSFLLKPDGPLEEDFKSKKSCKEWIESFRDQESETSYKAERLRGKMLFVWCIQNKMPKAAMRFWNQGQDCLAMILVACKELRMMEKALDNDEGRQEIKDQMQYFGTLALNFLRNCYAKSHQKTKDLIVGNVKDLGNKTPLKIAVDAKLYSFLSAEPTKCLLSKVWTNEIQFYDKKVIFGFRYLPMLLSFACPLFAPVALTIGKPSDDSKIRRPRLCPLPEPAANEIPMPTDDRNDECQNSSTPKIRKSVREYLSQLKLFMETPVVIFSYWFISYIVYILLFSIVLLTDFRAKISPKEIALTIWTSILLIEEIKQINYDYRLGNECNKWNCLDVLALLLYFIGFCVRMICPHCLYHARIVLAFSLLVFFLRTLQFLEIYNNIGPKIFMMERLIVADLIPFLVILVVFVSAYGVVSNVILYPNQPLNAKLLQDVFYDAWWSVLQQLNLDDALGSKCPKDVSANITAEYCSSTSDDNIDYERCKENQCPANKWIVSVLLAVYALVTCIMLLNVLIAMFNETFKNVVDRQRDISAMQLYRLLDEYMYFIRWMQLPYFTKKFGSPNVFLEKKLTPEVKGWQRDMADHFYNENQAKEEWPKHRMDSESSANSDDKIHDIPDKSEEKIKEKKEQTTR